MKPNGRTPAEQPPLPDAANRPRRQPAFDVYPDIANRRNAERKRVLRGTSKGLLRQGLNMPPSVAKDQVTRAHVLRQARADAPASRRRMYEQQSLIESHANVLEGMKDKGLDPDYLRTSKQNLSAITRYATIKDPAVSSFDVVQYATMVGNELTRVRQHRDDLRALRVADDDPRMQAVRSQEAYLQRLLDIHGIPHGEEMMHAFDVTGRRNPPARDRKVWNQARHLARVGGSVICGSFALLNAIIAIKADPKKPNFLAAAFWAAPLVLLNMNDKRDAMARELGFMKDKSFTGYAEKHGNAVAGPVRSLLESPGRGGAKRLLIDLRDGTAEKKTAARERLVDLLLDGDRGREALVNRMLANPRELADFLLPVLTHPKSAYAKEMTMQYLEKARAPSPDMLQTP
ncbi:MAG: hypothetical protein PHW10_05055 [Candidatus Peribacteraceae bacterium]|nr:hypothetical protein [Candidatus Peribacteraceae bacterium]